MSSVTSLTEVLLGVLEELRIDLADGLWSILQLIGVNNIIDQVLYDVHIWRTARGDALACGHNRSIIRIFASALPLRPVYRPYLKFVAVRSVSRSSSPMTLDSEMLTNDSYRTSTRQSFLRMDMQSDCNYEGRIGSVCHRPLVPFSAGSPRENVDLSSAADLKIASLQNELVRLREQVSCMMLQIIPKPISPPYTPDPSADESSVHSSASLNCTVPSSVIPSLPLLYGIPPSSPSSIPPPPPPPPPPTIMKSNMKSLSQMIHEGKTSINKHSKPIEIKPTKSGNLSMAEVLKGLNTIKLKRTDRSPGGTPYRIERSPNPDDPTAIMAAALKKKFAKIHIESFEKDGDVSDFGSPDPPARISRRDSPKNADQIKRRSPKVLKQSLRPAVLAPPKVIPAPTPPFGQHLLRRRSFQPKCRPESISPASGSSDMSR